MRIGIVTPGFSASERDWCIPVLLDLVRGLAATDRVSIVALRYPHRDTPYSVDGVPVLPLGGAEVSGLRRLAFLARARGVIARWARRERLDVLHAMWAHEPGFLATLAGRRTGVPTVVSLLGGELADLPDIGYGAGTSAVNRWLVRRALGAADRVHCASAWLGRIAAPRVPSERLVTVPLGVATERFGPAAGEGVTAGPELDGDPCLLHVASLVAVKDQATLLRAFAGILETHPRAALHLAGDGELRADLERLAAALGVAERVRFLGHVRHDQLPALFRRADLHLLPSRWDTGPMVVLEAAACACPTLGTAVGYLPELGPAARTVPIGDPDAFARETSALLADRETLERMGEASRQLVLERYRIEHTVEQLRALYRALIPAPGHLFSGRPAGELRSKRGGWR